ncbi:MAG: hemolysin family protein [Christensenella sp.]|uniref:hemolysin family protein n=1 Tax=Christensenella sp. TaxID=1935934 RepID=UPI002B213DC5|nr:hemolysin family protein [Christensenella sp.]MEA5004014.1 hemolysin family protein [Christensenella sp.]
MNDPIVWQLLLQVVLIALNAFFASTEIAVISLNANKLRRLADEGDKKAKQMLKMVETPAGFLSTIQIGITLAGFLGSAFAADNFASKLTDWMVNVQGFTAVSPDTLNTLAVIIITLVLSYFTLVFGELVPKRIAMQRPEKVARTSAGVITVLSVIMKPIIWLLSVSTNGILRLLRMNPKQKVDDVTEEEIRLMVDIGEEKGAIESTEKEMIENIFEFNNTIARDVMTHRTDVIAIQKDETPDEILQLIRESGLSRFPVYDEDIDNIIGTVNTRAYLLNLREDNPKPLTRLLRPVYCVPESVHTDVLFRSMQKSKNHIAVVVDEYGGTSGIVTMEDLLEEIVGNIYDEYDPQDEQEIAQLKDNLWRVAGGTDIETLNEALLTEIPEDADFDTLGGLVFSQLNSIPQDGSHPDVDVYGLHIHVEEIVERRVEWALVSKITEE